MNSRSDAAPTDVGLRSKRANGHRRLDDARWLDSSLVLLAPVVILQVAVFFIPLIYVGYQSLFDWQPGLDSAYVGLENYTTLFSQAEFWEVVRNQIIFLTGVPLFVLAPLVVAFLLHDHVANPGIFRTIYLFPAILSPAIVGLVFRSLLANEGPVNSTLESIGLASLAQPWLADASWVKPTIIVLMLWASMGIGVLIFSAALSAVPTELFEAARLDGAGFWRQLWQIATPSIRPTVVLWTMTQIIAVFLFMFSWIFVLTGGGPGLASTTMDFSIYQKFLKFGFFGAAAAQSVVLIAMVLIAALVFGALPRLFRAMAHGASAVQARGTGA
jgi:multiple sugar transport system permease protein